MRFVIRVLRRLYPTLLTVATAACLAAAFASGALAQAAEDREREQLLKYQEAVRIHREEGRSAEALEMLDAFVRMHPDSAYADDALLEAGRIQMALGDPKKAAASIGRMLQEYPSSPAKVRGLLELTRAYAAMEKWKDCIETANGVLLLDPLPDDRSTALNLRAHCLMKRGKELQAARDATDAYRQALNPELREAAQKTLLEAAAALKNAELDELLMSSDGQAPFGVLALLAVERMLEKGRNQEAMNALMDLLVHYPDQFSTDRVAQDFGLLKDRLFVRGNTIGAVLPLSGRYRVFGEKALQGIQAALGMLSPVSRHRTAVDFTLVVQDSAADPMKAAQAVRDLAEREQVLAIIGPVFSRTSRAAAAVAEEAGVPLVSLSPDPAIPGLGRNVFRRSLTDAQQIDALVRLVHDRLGMTRFAFLYPDSPYGREMMNIFWDQLELRGAQVTSAESFPQGQNDFGPQIRALASLNRRLSPEEQKRKDAGEDVKPDPIIDFDALFIPADFQTVGLLAPQLAYYEVNEVLLLGTDAWNSPWLTELGEHYVDGSIFTGGYVAGTEDPAGREMMERYWLTFGEEPQALAVQAYDAALIVRRGVESGVVRDRGDMRKYLSGLKEFPSAEGALSSDEEGDIVQRPVMLTVEGGRIVPLVLEVD